MQRRSVLLAALAGAGSAAIRASEVLERPARMSPLAPQRLVTGIARAGDALVAVGQRGHIVVSTDGGQNWAQAIVPVSSDLTAVRFVDAKVGYATGHDGVVLGTRDGGRSWERLLDGRKANALLLGHMKRRTAEPDASDTDRELLEEAQRNAVAGPDKPFLDLCFTSAEEGFVVGAYGLIMRTADGGRTWEPWFDRMDNSGLLNLYSICFARGAHYVAGEGGLLLKLERDANRFQALPSPYKGSYFGVAATRAGVLAYGMRGNAFLSEDAGATWASVATGLSASIVANAFAADGTLVLVDQAGAIARHSDASSRFTLSNLRSQAPLAAVAFAGETSLVVGGPRGLAMIDLTKDK